MNVSRKKASQAVPPEKGSFPLDHLAECTRLMEEYLKCVKDNGNISVKCRLESKNYLECRMEKELMAKEELKNLGFYEKEIEDQLKNIDLEHDKRERQDRGFVAGSGVKRNQETKQATKN